jgi:hypothetical protein
MTASSAHVDLGFQRADTPIGQAELFRNRRPDYLAA